MAKTTPEEREILRAKIVLEERIADAIYVVTNRFHEEHPAWMITAADLGIIDISTVTELRWMTASARVELTRKDGTLTLKKGGQVKRKEAQ